jgi:high-affinity Fe2+/Pb2+ permease
MLPTAVALAIVVAPGLAVACAVCMGGQEEASRKAFVLTTALMTFLPLAVLGIAAWWFIRAARVREEDDARRIAEGAIGGTRVDHPRPATGRAG